MENVMPAGSGNRAKFMVGGLLIVAAIVYLIITATTASAQFFLTVEELVSQPGANTERQLRVSGAVLGDTIQYDASTLTLRFMIAHIPGDTKDIQDEGGLAEALHAAVTDPSRPRLQVQYYGVKPDLLRDEAQAIMTGRMGEDGVFYAEELLLKCPTKYEDAVPEQTGG